LCRTRKKTGSKVRCRVRRQRGMGGGSVGRECGRNARGGKWEGGARCGRGGWGGGRKVEGTVGVVAEKGGAG